MGKSPSNLPKKIREMLETSSVNLVKLDDKKRPAAGNGSGCLIDYNGKRYLLTVTHNIKKDAESPVPRDEPELQLPMKFDSSRGQMILQPIGNNLVELTAGVTFDGMTDPLAGMKTTDLSYARYPFPDLPYFEKIDDNGTVLLSKPCTVFTELSIQEPNGQSVYGFAGHTKPGVLTDYRYAEERYVRETTFLTAFDLTYVGKEERKYGQQYAFQLPDGHSANDATFEGCSGAPIVDQEGKLVALVSNGDLSRSLIFGVPLKDYAAVLLCASLDHLSHLF